jgi:hypothetical protein
LDFLELAEVALLPKKSLEEDEALLECWDCSKRAKNDGGSGSHTLMM